MVPVPGGRGIRSRKPCRRFRTDARWREVPGESGPWPTVHGCFRVRRKRRCLHRSAGGPASRRSRRLEDVHELATGSIDKSGRDNNVCSHAHPPSCPNGTPCDFRARPHVALTLPIRLDRTCARYRGSRLWEPRGCAGERVRLWECTKTAEPNFLSVSAWSISAAGTGCRRRPALFGFRSGGRRFDQRSPGVSERHVRIDVPLIGAVLPRPAGSSGWKSCPVR
jgi:hypothetical protein